MLSDTYFVRKRYNFLQGRSRNFRRVSENFRLFLISIDKTIIPWERSYGRRIIDWFYWKLQAPVEYTYVSINKKQLATLINPIKMA